MRGVLGRLLDRRIQGNGEDGHFETFAAAATSEWIRNADAKTPARRRGRGVDRRAHNRRNSPNRLLGIDNDGSAS